MFDRVGVMREGRASWILGGVPYPGVALRALAAQYATLVCKRSTKRT